MKVTFEMDGLSVVASGVVTNAGYVTVRDVIVKDDNDKSIIVDKKTYEIIEELASEMLYDRKFNPELGEE